MPRKRAYAKRGVLFPADRGPYTKVLIRLSVDEITLADDLAVSLGLSRSAFTSIAVRAALAEGLLDAASLS